ncbi:thioredoxin-like 1-2, chloroplastic isoform X2 [Hevea brasiliensis]|uniref:thioredoxin-like 1-2, chloroplastic isoform X2 n=1 Tax=Hevea brasiliensis TaxID=3981 RepID=UPI0025D29A24|nr:thioredoxin-like 1-2, chloroplastic isoform X2 [Hevea brasiliensis]
MACSLNCTFSISRLNVTILSSKTLDASGFSPSVGAIGIGESKTKDSPVLRIDFMGKPLVFPDQMDSKDSITKAQSNFFAQASIRVSRALRWWENTHKPNMREIHSAQELVYSLLNAGDKLVIVDFYSPGCGGCKALHPKICQLAESNPNAVFLKVNYEELKTMCRGLHIHVLPFFRFYRGAEGRLCSFSCTNATIRKFKDALAKHGADGCSLGPAKGLDESELMTLASIGELPKGLHLKSSKEERVEDFEDFIVRSIDLPGVWSKTGNKTELIKEETAVGVSYNKTKLSGD